MDPLNIFYCPEAYRNFNGQIDYVMRAHNKYSSLLITDSIDMINKLAKTSSIKNFINISGTMPLDIEFNKIEDSIKFNDGNYTIYTQIQD